MAHERTLAAALHDPGSVRLPERAMRTAVLDAAQRTRDDGQDRAVLFDTRRRRFVIDTWPHDGRPDLAVVTEISTE